MPPSTDTEGVAAEHHYHLTQRMISNSISLGKKGLDRVKPYTPTRVQSLLEQTGERVNEYVVEPYAERAHEIVSNFDARLDSVVISPTVSVVKEASQRADSIITTTESQFDNVRHQMGFVGASITESCGSKEGSDDSEEAEPCEQTTLLQVAQDKVSTLRGLVSEKYYKVLENADHSIEVYFPESGDGALLRNEKAVSDPIALCIKAAKRAKPVAVDRLRESKARTEEQLQKLVHVDLISYAADVIDVTAATTYDVTVTRPLALKNKATTSAEQAREVVATKVADAKGKVFEMVQPALEKLYSAQVAEAYKLALEKATEKRDTVLILVSSTKASVSDTLLLVYNNGVKGLVVELRGKGFLPEDGKASIANAVEAAKAAPQTLRDQAGVLTSQLIEVAKKTPDVAKQQLTDLYTMLLTSKDKALEQVPIMYQQAREFAVQQSEKIMELLQSAPGLGIQKIQELYTWLLSLTPTYREQLEAAVQAAKELPTKAREMVVALPAAAEAKFPATTEKVKLAFQKLDTDVKPAVTAKWAALVQKYQVDDLLAKVSKLKAEGLPALVFGLTQGARDKATSLVTNLFSFVMSKTGFPTSCDKEVLASEESAEQPDPVDGKFEAYCKANGLHSDDETD
jgi:hypothetical protein